MRKLFFLAALVSLPTAVLADEFFKRGYCEGPSFVIDPVEYSLTEIVELHPDLPAPLPGQSMMMRFEHAKRAMQYWTFTDRQNEELALHCDTQYHLARKPKDGHWNVEALNIDLVGCPEDVPLPPLTGAFRELAWPGFFTPKPFFAQSEVDFDYEMLDRSHWLARANPIPGMPGTVEITYDFQAVNPERIDIQGNVNVQIEAGSASVNCTGIIDMVATHLAQ